MYTIEHNPFFQETKIWIGDILTEDEQLSELKNRPFRDIVDKIPKALSDDANDDINLIFIGRHFEYEDLVEACNYYTKDKGNVKFMIEHQSQFENIDIDKIKSLATLMKKSPIAEIKNQENIDEFLAILENNEFDIVVVATVSSGKSTLINALIGDSLLPSSNEATTAKIFRIKDIDEMEIFEVEVLDENDRAIVEKQVCTQEILEGINQEEKAFKINIEGDLPNISSDVMNLVIIDTPGTNNSQDARHKEVTYQLIKDDKTNPIVIFVLDAVKPKVNDEAELLQVIAEEIKKKNTKQVRDRFIFVLNKADGIDAESKDDIQKQIDKTKDFLSKDFGIKDARIYPVTAIEALIGRKVKNNIKLLKDEKKKRAGIREVIEDEDNEYSYLHFEQYAPISKVNQEKIQQKINVAKEKDDWAEQAIHHSGISALEMVIDDYVTKYAMPIKIDEAFRRIESIIKIEEIEQEIQENASQNEQQREKYEKELEVIRLLISKGTPLKNFKKKIEILKIDDEPIKKLRGKIINVFTNLYRKTIFIKDVNLTQAKREIEGAIKKIESLQIDIKTELDRQLENELYTKSKQMVNSLQKEMEDIFDKKDKKGLIWKKKQANIAALPNPKQILQQSQKIEYYKRTVDREADAWDWLGLGIPYLIRDDKVEVDATRKVSDHKKIKKQFDNKNKELLKKLKAYETNATKRLDDLKESAEQIVEKYLNTISNENLKEQTLMRNRNALLQKINKNREAQKWIKNYKEERRSIQINLTKET